MPFLKGTVAGIGSAFQSIRHSTRLGVLISLLVLLAIGIHATWFTAWGKFPVFNRDFNAYVDLDDAFLHGQLSLLEQPDPRLGARSYPVPLRPDLLQRQVLLTGV